MKYSTVSIIAAALASVCSATDLPAKFGLSIAPPAGSSALNSLAAEVVAETFYGGVFTIFYLLIHTYIHRN